MNNIHNEIKMVAYGKEQLTHILENEYKMIEFDNTNEVSYELGI